MTADTAHRCRALGLTLSLLSALALATAVRPATAQTPPPPDPRELAGGAATVFERDAYAFGRPLANLPAEDTKLFERGRSRFQQTWVQRIGTSYSRHGLGPLFNNRSCMGCHEGSGRGIPPESSPRPLDSMVLRLSMPGTGEHGGPLPHPVYGYQIQDRGLTYREPEGLIDLTWTESSGQYPDGTPYTLLAPKIAFASLNYGAIGDSVMTSLRLAPQLPGLGLLEAVDESSIRALADPKDANGDGISGRPNEVWDRAAGKHTLGRFGWKAGQPTVPQQNGGALMADIGISSDLYSDDEIAKEMPETIKGIYADGPEIWPEDFAALNFYVRTLGVPARRWVDDPQVRLGETLFAKAGCVACHVPDLHTAATASVPALASQTIHPYSDLLLHDMGDGLADGRPEWKASGSEWRTAPLWGIGLLNVINGHTRLLHDGRARSVEEAILWHGGEAQASADHFKSLTAQERKALLRFVYSL